MIAQAWSNPMNRNAVASIFLSVSIVCFFAVALYRHDPVRGQSPKRREAGPPPKGREPIKSSGEGIAAVDRDSIPVAGRAGTAVGHPPASTVGPAARALAGPRDRRKPANPIEDLAGSGREPGGGSHGRTRSDVTGPMNQVSPGPAGPDGTPGLEPHPRAPTQAESPSVRLARAPFTIVGAGETIADVARRIYGPGDDDVQWLRRANRDVLDGPGEALPPGTVLRTPARSMR